MPPKVAAPVVSTEPKNITLSVTILKKNVKPPVDPSAPAPAPVPVTTSAPAKGAPAAPAAPVAPALSPRASYTYGIRMRVFSSWTELSTTTPVFGQADSLPWVIDDASNTGSIKLEYKFDCNLPDNDAIRAFHSDPMIYFFFSFVNDTTIKPVEVLSIDCSSFLLKQATLELNRTFYNNEYAIQAKVVNIKPLKTLESLLSLEPLILRIKR